MGYSHLLPELPAGLAKSAARPPRNKRKLPLTESAGRRGFPVVVPDEVVAGIKWCQAERMVYEQVRALYPGLPRTYFDYSRDEILRKHVRPQCPPFINEASWKERYRWPLTVKD